MLKSTIIAAFCVAFITIDAVPVDTDEATELPQLMPDELQRIANLLSPRDVMNLGVANKRFDHLVHPSVMAESLYERYGNDAPHKAFKTGIRDLKVYNSLLEHLGETEETIQIPARVAGQKGDLGAIDGWIDRLEYYPGHALVGAAEAGNVRTYDHARALLDDNIPDASLDDMMHYAARKGQTDFLNRLRNDHGPRYDRFVNGAMDQAASNNHHETAKMLHDGAPEGHKRRLAAVAAVRAARYNHSDLFHVFFSHADVSDLDAEQIIDHAAHHNNLDIMRTIDDTPLRPFNRATPLRAALSQGNREAVDYLRDSDPDWHVFADSLYRHAVEHDDKGFEEEVYPHITADGMRSGLLGAAASGSTEKLDRYISKHRDRFGDLAPDSLDNLYRDAAVNGNVDLLRYLHQHGPASKASVVGTAFDWAVYHGHIDVVAHILQSGLGGHLLPDRFQFNDDVMHGSGDPKLVPIQLLVAAKYPKIMRSLVDAADFKQQRLYAKALPAAKKAAIASHFDQVSINRLSNLESKLSHQ